MVYKSTKFLLEQALRNNSLVFLQHNALMGRESSPEAERELLETVLQLFLELLINQC